MVSATGTAAATFAAFAVVDELVRTLVEAGVMSKIDALAMLRRTLDNARRAGNTHAIEAAGILEKMVAEYSQ